MSSTSENEQLGVRAKTPSSLVGMFDVRLLFAKMAKKRSYEVTAPIAARLVQTIFVNCHHADVSYWAGHPWGTYPWPL